MPAVSMWLNATVRIAMMSMQGMFVVLFLVKCWWSFFYRLVGILFSPGALVFGEHFRASSISG